MEENVISYEAIATNETEQVVLKLSELGYPVSNETNSFGKKIKSYMSCAVGRIRK